MDEPQEPDTTYGEIMDVAHKFGKLKLEEKELKAKMDALKLSIAPLHDQMLAHMEEACIDSMKLGMGLSLYLHTQIWAKLPEGVEKSALIAQLKASADTEFLVAENYNTQKLSAFIREFPEDDSGKKIIPDELKGVLEANEVVQVRARKS